MPRGPRKNRGKKPPGGDHGPRHAADPLDEDHDMLTPPTPRYLPPQPSRPRGGGGSGGRQPPSINPPPATTALTTRRNRHPPPTHLIHPPITAPPNSTPRPPPPPTNPTHYPYPPRCPTCLTTRPPPPPPQPNPYPPRCPTCHTTSCVHHHASHAAIPCCAHCDFVRRCNYDLRDAVAASLASCGAALARWADDVGVGSGGSVDMMEWQPEGTTLVVLGGEWGAAAGGGGEGQGGKAVVEGHQGGQGRDGQGQVQSGQAGGQAGGGGGGVSPHGNKAPSPPAMPAPAMSPPSIARIAMENKNRRQQPQSQHQPPYQAVNMPPTPPFQAAMTAALVDMGAKMLQVPPAQPQPQEAHPVVNGGGSGWPPQGLGFEAGGGPPVQDGVPRSSFQGYRDS